MLYLIDKTAALEQAVGRFPALYIEGAAASGKSTAVQMMLKKHPEIIHQVFRMDQEAVRLKVMEKLDLWMDQESVCADIPEPGGLLSGQETIYADTEKILPQILGQSSMARGASERWLVFENVPREMPEKLSQNLAAFVKKMPEHWKAIFVSREQPPEAFLDLIWKRQMEIIPQGELLFSLEEVQELTVQAESPLQPEELYRITGGWAGCVDIMIRLSGRIHFQPGTADRCAGNGWESSNGSVSELRRRYEIDAYIQREILDTLSEQEQVIVKLGAVAPWINEAICREIWGMDDAQKLLKELERKGILVRNGQRMCWKTAPLFSGSGSREVQKAIWKSPESGGQENAWRVSESDSQETPERVADPVAGKILINMEDLEHWYEDHGFLREALWCYRQFSDESGYCACLIRHYEKIPFLGVSYAEILKYKDSAPKAAYLRGMCHRASGNFRKMSREAEMIGPGYPEIYLNLMFADPEISLDEWLELAAKLSEEQKRGEGKELSAKLPGDSKPDQWQGKFRLYEILGSSHTYLCGMRDLSDLFACTKKEENRKAHIWKSIFGEQEWRVYCLARANYYLETDRGKNLLEEDIELLSQIVQPTFLQKIQSSGNQDHLENPEWKDGITGLYLYCLMQAMQPDEEKKNKIFQLADALRCTGEPACIHTMEAVMGIFAHTLGRQENLGRWLLTDESREFPELTYTELVLRTRGYLMLHQYGKAGRLLQKNVPYLRKYRMTSLYVEALFQQAVVNWHMEQHGQALQNVIESFLVNGSCRYVGFYTIYGNPGVEVLEAYVEWMQKNISGGWKRKKKYNYGNVLRMPVEDYLDVILRKAKRTAQKGGVSNIPEQGESLTMMETIVLQAICQGLSNAEISEQQNLKITTVKSHIYSMYKKLGVKSRMQAALKGKELGIV